MSVHLVSSPSVTNVMAIEAPASRAAIGSASSCFRLRDATSVSSSSRTCTPLGVRLEGVWLCQLVDRCDRPHALASRQLLGRHLVDGPLRSVLHGCCHLQSPPVAPIVPRGTGW